MMKVLTILGTRPEIIRLSRVIEKLDQLCRQVVVHTGQNYDRQLDAVFFEQLQVRAPDHHLGARGSFGQQIGTILAGCERILTAERPDRFLVLGDTNSSLGAIMAKRLGIPVFHMEAGNRCYDDRVPEEVNRRLIDHASDVLMPYTERSRQNLLREGIAGERIYVTGNPIYEVLRHYERQIAASQVLSELKLEPGRFFLVTLHRAENVDVPERLDCALRSFELLAQRFEMPVIVSTHPRMRARLEALGGSPSSGSPSSSGSSSGSLSGGDLSSGSVRLLEPFSFFDFVHLEQTARCVLSDSGTVQEECAILRVPSVTLRDTTERPETLECGSSILSGIDVEAITRCVSVATRQPPAWSPPPEYVVPNVSDTVVNIVLGFHFRH
jgi:UDP-N-acetylglucosamine 2-epimerase (non-hydrolysing)